MANPSKQQCAPCRFCKRQRFSDPHKWPTPNKIAIVFGSVPTCKYNECMQIERVQSVRLSDEWSGKHSTKIETVRYCTRHWHRYQHSFVATVVATVSYFHFHSHVHVHTLLQHKQPTCYRVDARIFFLHFARFVWRFSQVSHFKTWFTKWKQKMQIFIVTQMRCVFE